MKCQKCGASVGFKDEFCPACGEKVEAKKLGFSFDKEQIKETAANATKAGGKMAKKASEKATQLASKSKDMVDKSQQTVINALDQDGNGQIDSVDIILMALKVPGVKINREEFLRKELFKNYPSEVIDKAIESNPAQAGIAKEDIDKIADEVIKFERNAVSGISVALGVPGGAAMAATIPADIAQYYGYMLRAAQKMLYLYGFPELNTKENDVMLDSETINCLTICLGIMYGVASANNAIKAMAKALASGVEKKLLHAALTKGAFYPIVKSVAKWFSVNMTKEVFAGFFKKTIPVVGGVIGGGITFVTFKPCCDRLKEALTDTMLSNPEKHKESEEEKQIFNDIKNEVIIDVDEDEITVIDDSEADCILF